MNFHWQKRIRPAVASLAAALCVLVSGCASNAGKTERPGGEKAVAALTKKTAESSRGPFAHKPLLVRNSCFVESVHFHDQYHAMRRGGAGGWVRVLQWGDRRGNPNAPGLGHAVAVCRVGNTAWMYDVNKGFVALRADAETCKDVAAAGPEIFKKYPQFKATFVTYDEDDAPPAAPDVVPEYLFTDASRDVREATKVASELARFRVARVIGFTIKDRRNNSSQQSAATVFRFGERICVYFPARGTYLARMHDGELDDLTALAKIVRQIFSGACAVRWHDGPVWYSPKRAAPTPRAGAGV